MTTKYLKITNKADLVSRVSLEKLGLSTKRNDPTTIGQFGSGIKFAPIAALRKGLEWWFTGTDSNGSYSMRYITQMEDGIECIAYEYGDYIKPSSFTVDAGNLSWIDDFQIYREAVSNAMDEANDKNDWSISIVDATEIIPVEGEFSVFITASPAMMAIHNDFNKYFSLNRDRINCVKNVEFLKKIDSAFRVYCHDVLVYSSESKNSLYDYNINTLTLNEERNVKYIWDVETAVTQAMYKIQDQRILESIIRKVQNEV